MTFHNLTHVIERLQFKTQLLFINCNEKTLLHFFCFVIKLPIKTECYWLQELFLLSRFCNFLALFKSYMKNNSRETLTLTLPLLEAVSKTYLILFIHKKRKKKRVKAFNFSRVFAFFVGNGGDRDEDWWNVEIILSVLQTQE